MAAIPLEELAFFIAQAAAEQAKANMGVKTGQLQKFTVPLPGETPYKAVVKSLSYYARPYHDGWRHVAGKQHIWFTDWRLDPRIAEAPEPTTEPQQLRPLTKAEFLNARERGVLVISTAASSFQGNPFFSNAKMAPVKEAIRLPARESFHGWAKTELKSVWHTVIED